MSTQSPSGYQSINLSGPTPDPTQPRFQLSCPPKTDIWDKPPHTHSFNAPRIFKTAPLSSFRSAQVTISADWKHQYDQGGLCLVIQSPSSGARQWIKTGIEFYEGTPYVATVATDRWSDWSLVPNPSGEGKATIRMERAGEESLWVYLVDHDKGGKVPLREVTWVIDVDGDAVCQVGVYAAKPAPGGESGDLTVDFEGLSIELK